MYFLEIIYRTVKFLGSVGQNQRLQVGYTCEHLAPRWPMSCFWDPGVRRWPCHEIWRADSRLEWATVPVLPPKKDGWRHPQGV